MGEEIYNVHIFQSIAQTRATQTNQLATNMVYDITASQ